MHLDFFESIPSNNLSRRVVLLDDDVRSTIAKYNSFLSKAESYKIQHCFGWKYLVDVSISSFALFMFMSHLSRFLLTRRLHHDHSIAPCRARS